MDKPTWKMSIDELKREMKLKENELTRLDIDSSNLWTGERQKLNERIAFLDTLIKQRQKVGDVEDKSK